MPSLKPEGDSPPLKARGPSTVETHCEDETRLLSELDPSKYNAWGFRGHGSAAWTLTPPLLRRPRFQSLTRETNVALLQELLAFETQIMQEFVQRADQHGLSVPQFDIAEAFESFLEFVRSPMKAHSDTILKAQASSYHKSMLPNWALAQHYGCPTRLLDWTWRPFIAAYFAAKDACCILERVSEGRAASEDVEADKLGLLAVWALPPIITITSAIDGSTRKAMDRVEMVRAPRSSNPNLGAQAGFFTLDRSHVPLVPLEERVRLLFEGQMPRDDVDGLLRPLKKFTMPMSRAGHLLQRLRSFDINAASVYPGYGGVAESLRESRFYPDETRRMAMSRHGCFRLR